ncbi:hypothetical protein ACFLUO_07145 [Chloroflexota bacterium]
MATKRRNLFLYLTLACFFGLIAIFIVDGYMGVYDTLYITAGERPQTIEADVWLRQDSFWSIRVNRGETASFRYEVDNRQFSIYTADIGVSLWQNQEKVRDITAQPISVASFGKEQLEWAVDTAEVIPGDIPLEQYYQYTVIIKRGEIERRIIMDVNPVSKVPLPVR